MKIFILVLLTAFSFYSCSEANAGRNNDVYTVKTALQLEDSSVKSGNRIDTLSRGFFIGMTPEQVGKQSKKLEAENVIGHLSDGRIFYRFETKNFTLSNGINFYYYNDRLYRITESTINDLNEPKNKNNVNFKEEVLIDAKKNWGQKPFTKGTQPSKYYWLKRNVRIDYLENEYSSAIAISDIGMERELIAFNEAKVREEQKRMQAQSDSINNANRIIEKKIIEKLKAKAKRDWPEDYTTQEFWIKEQIADYYYMKTISDEDKIKKKAQRDWPLDFSTQKFWYNEQIDARVRLK